MTKWIRIILISSLALNVILIVGFVLFKKSMNKSMYKIGVLNAAARATSDRHVLYELETGDPNKIDALKQYLRDSIEMNSKEAEEYRKAAK
jgi:hypothetical protein